MNGDTWEQGWVTLPGGRIVAALRNTETGAIHRNRGLYAPVTGTRPVSEKTADTWRKTP